MTLVVLSYILVAPSPEGFGLDMPVAVAAAAVVDLLCTGFFVRYEVLRRRGALIHDVAY